MNKKDLRVYRAWHFCETVLGPTLTNELKRGRSIYIAAKNGEVYELGPRGTVGSVTRNRIFCVQMGQSMFGDSDYPFPDRIVHRFDWITKDPDGFNRDAHEEPVKLDSRRGRNFIMEGGQFVPRQPRRINMDRFRYIIENNISITGQERAQYILWAQSIGENVGVRMGRAIESWRSPNRR